MPQKKKITALSKKVSVNSQKIKGISDSIKPISSRPTVKISSKEILLKRAILKPNFSNKTVLTDSTWRYVEIFLKEKKSEEALFYWEQAFNFYKATKDLSLISAPLTTYYAFLNATKALLTYKNVGFDLKHGVSGQRTNGHYTLQNEIVKLKPKGIASSLCTYLKEPIPSIGVEYTLKDIIYNLQFIHRSFCLTYSTTEIFIPIINPRFVFDRSRGKAWFEAQLEEEHSKNSTLKKLIGFGIDDKYDNSRQYTIRRNKTFDWLAPRNKPTDSDLLQLNNYHVKIRNQLRYIYSPTSLWYIKRKDIKTGMINRGTLPLAFIAMHRLSELARYEPQTLKKHLEKKHSWLLSEFITKSIYQFIDQISSEITGDDFRLTGFRA